MRFTRYVILVCQWCIVSVLVGDTLLRIVYVLPCVLYMSIYELNHILVILLLEWDPPQVTGILRSAVCVCVCVRERKRERERDLYVCLRLLICTHDLKYFLM